MKKYISIILILIIASLLSYFIDWFNYIIIFSICITLIFLLIVGLISIFKKVKSNIIKIPLIILGICGIALFISFFRPYRQAIITTDNVSKNLEYAYNTDQNDRKEIRSFTLFANKFKERDHLRLDQVREYYLENKLSTPLDKFHAAFIFHHSNNSKDYKIASALASEAAENEKLKDNYIVQWLGKAAYDRYMKSIGKPEKYNTQDKFSIDFE